MLSAVCLVVSVLGASMASDSQALAVYGLSFWHYPLYWWAYRYGAVRASRFRREAVLTKTVALAAFGFAYLGTPPHALSIAVVTAGFLLNAAAARALGPVRTYYGWELGAAPRATVTAFPFTVLRHPMLLGNVLAYAGALLNPAFRGSWWPLGCGHVVLNLALLAMETTMTPLGRTRSPGRHVRRRAGRSGVAPAVCLAAAVTAAGAALAGHVPDVPRILPLAGMVAATAGHILLTRARYGVPTRPTFWRGTPHPRRAT
jgi:protein-S-isoprenylcysteine O-methyltransferase Ste14